MSDERFAAVGCTHGDRIDKKAAAAFFEFVAEYKPKHRFHLGDIYDFRNLRRGADPREEGDSLQDDWKAGNLFLNDFKPTVITLGNHDARIYRAASDSRGLVRDYAASGVMEIEKIARRHKATLLPYDSRRGVYRFGDTSLLHGYHAGVGATRQHAAIYRKSIYAHLHRVESATVPGLDDAQSQCIGSLADFESMEYAAHRTATLAWRAAWCFGVINTRSQVVSWWTAVQQPSGDFVYPTGLKVAA